MQTSITTRSPPFPWKQDGFKQSAPVIRAHKTPTTSLSCSYLGDLQRLLLLLAPLQPEAPRRPSAHSNAEIIPCAHFPGAVGQHSQAGEHEKLGLQMFSELQIRLPGRAGDPEHHTVAAAVYCTSKCSH